jgi:uncharacterized membrane protein SpoIIM required for sporulation
MAVIEAAFTARRRRDWDELDGLVRRAQTRGLRNFQPSEVSRLPLLYREACADLSRAQAARYSAPLVEYLHGLTATAHAIVYGPHAATSARSMAPRALRSAIDAFPRAVRKRWRAVLVAAALFVLPFAFGLVATKIQPEFAFRIVPESMLKPLTEAYLEGFDKGRGAGADAMMAGFYVNNNVGIALRCFALGIFGGLGSAFYLIENGLAIGATLGYVASRGAGANIVTFIVGHGTLELGAIVLAGGAGIAMGWSIVAPGDKTRIASLQEAAREVMTIVFGAAVMLLMAAGIEGFWSGSSAPASVKRSIGAMMLVVVSLYIALAGRGRDKETEAARWT